MGLLTLALPSIKQLQADPILVKVVCTEADAGKQNGNFKIETKPLDSYCGREDCPAIIASTFGHAVPTLNRTSYTFLLSNKLNQ